MANRKAIQLKVQLAAALLQLVDRHGDHLIPYPDSKMMTASQIVSLFELDHFPIRVADDGVDEAWNLTWRLRAEHKRKTAKIDQPELGKQRRIRAREQDHKNAMLYKTAFAEHTERVTAWRKPQIPSRPFPKGRKFAKRASS